MRKSILAMFVMMIALFAVACGGNKPANGNGTADGGNSAGKDGGGEAAEDMMAFYKKAGNFYMAKTTTKMAALPDPQVSYMKMEITKSDDKGYVTKMTTYDKDKKETYSAENPMTEWPKATGEAPKDGAPAPKIESEEVEVGGKKLKCMKIVSKVGDNETTSWSYKGMPVKSITKGKDMESTMETTEFKCE